MQQPSIPLAERPLRVCVMGLWHLGSVTAACLAAAGHEVTGVDEDAARIEGLRLGRAPLAEPGLDDLLAEGIEAGRLRFVPDASEAAAMADVTWITFDTPVDDDDRADVAFVLDRVRAVSSHLRSGSTLLVSSQLPVGSTARLRETLSSRGIVVAYSPENLRLGKAIEAFTRAVRTIVGVHPDDARATLESLLSPFAGQLVWMSISSAEMTKHAINAFLATSVAFTNELARLCEVSGADASDVERGLRSEPRIGRGAYVRAGAAFAGGTLARDVIFLEQLGDRTAVSTSVMDGVLASNRAHQLWPDIALARLAGATEGLQVAVWGLAYTVGTSTLRRSSALELCDRLAAAGARVRAFDPAVSELPTGHHDGIQLADGALSATEEADALIVMTPWPEFAEIDAASLRGSLRRAVVIDPNADLARTLDVPGIRYASVGRVPA